MNHDQHAQHDHGSQHASHHEEIERLIAHVPIFSELSSEEVADLATRVRPRNYPAGEQLYGAGDANPNLLIIHTGRMRIYRLSESGHEQVIRVLGPGDFLGGVETNWHYDREFGFIKTEAASPSSLCMQGTSARDLIVLSNA